MLQEVVPYLQLKPQISPFDLIAFRGGDPISDMIEKLEEFNTGNGDFTHVGMVVTSDVLSEVDGFRQLARGCISVVENFS